MLYFAYGSNLNKIQMKQRCGDSIPVAKVTLKDYELVFNKYADVIENKGQTVHGAIYKVSEIDIKNLDIYEGYPDLYKKVDVKVTDESGKEYNAFVYVMVVKGLKKPEEEYYNIIVEGYKNWGLCLDNLESARGR
ncbi:AIG2-like family protein [Clostridium acetireducens DSM 10703]|uniref:AIG2-like family protein n=1 Tax=Clostridium acetireducens DSM 10703 TaxID=1121290 RepID=A0A1E8EZR9_9CLOT|nr:gamma-glutamylcyclotransferase family protein [Clostridium acetireducens]OFI06660.1 AIG2-like family protein [Clostridium acetireducens DSM 10703]